MAKAVKVLCDRCECKLSAGSSFCASCGYPTRWATHDERTAWEVSQWKAADRSHLPKSAKDEAGSRRWNPFARKPAKPALKVVRSERPAVAGAAPEPAPAPAAASVETAAAPAVKQAPAAALAPAPKIAPAPKVAPAAKIAPAPKPAPTAIKPAAKIAPVAAKPKPAPTIAAKTPPATLAPVTHEVHAPEAATVTRGSVTIERSPADDKPLTDAPATIMAVRLLNARVAELDEKIQRLERELDESRSGRRGL